MLNIYEVLFTIFNSVLLIIFAIFIISIFKKSRYSKKEIMKRLNELDEEISKIKNENK